MKLKAMRINGWQRLWILLSTLWAISVVAGTILVLPSDEKITKEWATATAEKIGEKAAQHRDSRPDEEEKGIPSVEIGLVFAQDDYREYVREKQAEYSNGEDWKTLSFADINARFESRLTKLRDKQHRILLPSLALWIIPCLLLYVLGMGIAWVRRGFHEG